MSDDVSEERPFLTDDSEERPFRVVVWAWDLDEAAQDALFDRIADAAHALDESVMCSGSLADDEDQP